MIHSSFLLRLACTAAVLLLLPSSLRAQVPRFEEVTGHAFGARITLHHEMVRYLEALAARSPRVRVVAQGTSWEGRTLPYAIVTAPENMSRIEEIQAAAQRLSDPRRTTPAEAAALVRRQPVIAWLGGSIHGYELSGTEGVLKLLEHLTMRDDAATLQVLQNVVVLIDPILNPDGREAFAQINHQHIGRIPTASRADWSNDFTMWQALKYRTGHYYFDTNRDWFAHTQAETRARIPTFRTWRPQIGIDLHEQSPDVEFYFDPPGEPYGPFFPAFARTWFDAFGEAYAKAFDQAGFEYFARERYNYFYPGYTTSYLSQQGAVGMLFEQASSRGLAITRADESVRTLGDALMQQYTAAWTALELAARERERLLQDYYAARQAAIDVGAGQVRRYLIEPDGDPNHVAELVNLLMRNGIEVHRATAPFQLSPVRGRSGEPAGRRSFPEGTFLVEAAQPLSSLVRTLLEPDLPIDTTFLKAARAYVMRDQNPRFYDITAWSLPLLFNLSAYSSTDARPVPASLVDAPVRAAGNGPAAQAEYAYLIDGRQAASLGALHHLKQRGYRAAFLTKPTRIGERPFGSGTVILRVGQNPDSLHEAVRELAARYRLDVTPVSTGLSEAPFPTLGSGDVSFPVKAASIALLAEEPISPLSFGWAWYTLDQQYEIPVTVIRTRSVAGTPLHDYNVLVLPEVTDTTALAELLGKAGMDRLRQWVRDGGTLVAIGGGVEFARGPLGLVKLRTWYDGEHEKAQRFAVPGAIVQTVLDPETWLTAGYEGNLPVLVGSSRLYLAPDGPPAAGQRVAARYAAKDALRLSGHLWPETLERLPGTVFAYEERVGRGRVIALAEDPNFRAYWRGANRLFLNAVVLGPSAP